MKGKTKMISSMLIFGSIGIFVRNIDLSSLEIAFLRAAIASCVLLIAGKWMWRKNSLTVIKRNLFILTASGAAIGFNWVFLFQAYKYTTIANATLSYYFAPVFVIAFSPFILKERITGSKVLCVLLAMVGLFFILASQAKDSQDTYYHMKGILFGLMGAVLYAGVVLMNKHIRNLSSFEITLIQLFVSAIVVLPFVAVKGGSAILQMNARSLFYILVVGIIHTGLAYLLYFSAVKALPAQSVAILSYIDPISAVVFAALFLREGITLFQIAGGVLILSSTFLYEKVAERQAGATASTQE